MQDRKNVIECYDRTASNYAEKFLHELNYKHLDRILLQAFASENIGKGKLIDLGCGPGQTTKFLFDCGLTDVEGIDISPKMVAIARDINPQVQFKKGDILNLDYPDGSFGSAIAFYSIVHFDYEQIKTAFKEIKRVLRDDGQFLFSFHVGESTVHLDTFLDHKVNIDFYFFDAAKIKAFVLESGFELIDMIERQPYSDVEYHSVRAYIWTKSLANSKTKSSPHQ